MEVIKIGILIGGYMIDIDDYFGGLTEEEYVEQTEKHFKWLKENALNEGKKMEWNVFYHDINHRQIQIWNIFEHGRFRSNVEKHLKECKSKEEFAEKLRSELLYNFWCKSEYEVLISPWVGVNRCEEIKVDIFSQVMLNKNVFVDYCWSFKEVSEE